MSMFGWVCLGVALKGHRLVEPSGYQRPQVVLSGSGQIDHVNQIDGLLEPWDAEIKFGGLYDALHQGRCLAYWLWVPPLARCPGSFTAGELVIYWAHDVQLALNASREGSEANAIFAEGARLARVTVSRWSQG